MSRRSPVFLVLLSLALASCTNYEKLATDELEGSGMTKVALTSTGKGSFDYTATNKAGEPCHGTITLTKSLGTTTKLESHQCGAPRGPERACTDTTPDVCYEQAQAHEKAGEMDKARESYAQGCDKRHGSSCNDLGVRYYQGKGGPKDAAKALTFFTKACDIGNPTGCKNAGIALTEAQPPQLEAAFTVLKKSCDLGLGEGCYVLGARYVNGMGVAADPVAGVAAFDKGCKDGEDSACGALGLYTLLGQGTAADVPGGAKLLDDACNKGVGEACKNLAILVREGKAPPKDLKRVVSLLDKGCSLKDPACCGDLGLAYDRGQGTAKDLKRANALYQQACDMGLPQACANLAVDLHGGLGIPKDDKHAAELFDKACAAGLKSACDARKKIH